MIFLYSFLLVALGALKALFTWRARRAETCYGKAALAVEKLTRGPEKAGNGKLDAASAAKRQYQLGALVQVRDALEAKHDAWQTRADRLKHWVANVKSWRGRKLPYTAGVLDVWMTLALLDHFGAGDYFNAKALTLQAIEWVKNLR